MKKAIIADIQAGFIDTPMAKGDGLFWVASTRKAIKDGGLLLR